MSKPSIHTSIAHVSYLAGLQHYYSGSAEADVNQFVQWAKEFQESNTETELPYMEEIEVFTIKNIVERMRSHNVNVKQIFIRPDEHYTRNQNLDQRQN